MINQIRKIIRKPKLINQIQNPKLKKKKEYDELDDKELEEDDKESDDELEYEEMKHRHNYMNYRYSYTNDLNYINHQILLELKQINEYLKREHKEKERNEMINRIVNETMKAQQNSEEKHIEIMLEKKCMNTQYKFQPKEGQT